MAGVGATGIVAEPGPDWHVAGDFSGNGMSDILWHLRESHNRLSGKWAGGNLAPIKLSAR